MKIKNMIINESNSIMQIENKIIINGEELPPVPGKCQFMNSTIINNHIFVNGYEWKQKKWKRTLRSIWHLWF